MSRPAVQMSEVQLRANEITDKTLEATRDMKRLACETRQIGADTAQELNRQGEQLDGIETKLDNINEDLTKAEKHLAHMERFCGCCPCTSRNRGKSHDANWRAAQNVNAGATVTTQPHGYEKGEVAQSGYIKKITNDAREDEMDENLAVVADVVGDLKMMALDMGDELDRQNAGLDRINEKTTLNVGRVQDAEARTNKLLQS